MMPPIERAPQRFSSYAAPGDLAARSSIGTAAIVLAGTHRWGDSPFAHIRSPLVPVALAPLIHYPLTWLRDAGIMDVVVCANSSTSAVARALGDGSRLGMSLGYYADRSPRGAAGCVRDAAAALDAGTLLVVEGAIIPSVDIGELLAAHRASGAIATAVTEIDRRQNTLTRQRPQTPGGIYVFERAALEFIAPTGFQDIKEGLLERLYRAGARVNTHEVLGVAPRVIDYASYVAVNRWLIERSVRERSISGFVARGDAFRHPTAVISPDARIIGPVLVGAGARIEGNAVVVGPAVIGPDARIEAGAFVARSILWRRAVIEEGALVDGSLITDGTVVDAGVELFGGVHVGDAGSSAVAGRRSTLKDTARAASLRIAGIAGITLLGGIAREFPVDL